MAIPRKLAPDDVLYRRLDAIEGHWDAANGECYYPAFADEDKNPPYSAMSVFAAKEFESPSAFLESQRKNICRMCKVPDTGQRAEELYELGFGVAAITVKDALDLGLQFKDYDGGDYNPKGHADIIDGQSQALAFALRAKVLSEKDLFG